MRKIVFNTIGIIEMLIGITTLVVCFAVQTWGIGGFAVKSPNVYIFVVTTATMSFALGVGMLFNREWARKLLIFFSGYIIITKILIYLGLLTFNGEIFKAVPTSAKNIISLLYHILLIVVLIRFSNEGKEDSKTDNR
ncbi:MAG TPA: hypothetical protein PKY78_02880 [Candidatus Omnitrophota bacterium]|nr:hypothetical protein [Candidatus Omnitrophota bacterium]HPS19919.1 hypothetical protein [Candidatus Omnitrophota bacterium]